MNLAIALSELSVMHSEAYRYWQIALQTELAEDKDQATRLTERWYARHNEVLFHIAVNISDPKARVGTATEFAMVFNRGRKRLAEVSELVMNHARTMVGV